MILLRNLPYNKPTLLDNSFKYQGDKQGIYLSKSYFKDKSCDQYFLKIYTHSSKIKDIICQGYIYFYLDQLERKSKFIGIYIKEEYRNTGLASLLVSSWIQVCLENGFTNLVTNQKQRKPFLLYLLKKYEFELLNSKEYQTSPNTIHICQEDGIDTKYLLFKNKKQAETFSSGSIVKSDNYHIIDKLEDDIHILDNVLLSRFYLLQNEEKAYAKSLETYEKHRG